MTYTDLDVHAAMVVVDDQRRSYPGLSAFDCLENAREVAGPFYVEVVNAVANGDSNAAAYRCVRGWTDQRTLQVARLLEYRGLR